MESPLPHHPPAFLSRRPALHPHVPSTAAGHAHMSHLLGDTPTISAGKDKLGWVLFSPYTVEPTYKGQVGSGSFVLYTVEPTYKGQVGSGSFVLYTVEPTYKGQDGDGSFVPCTVESQQVGDGSFVCPLYNGASLQGTSWGLVLCPL